MNGKERRQHMDWTMLGLIDDLEGPYQAIEPKNEKCAYLDWTFDISSIEGYEDNPTTPLRVENAPPAHPHVLHQL
ncbi:hypothetical protein E5676_scaffold69G00080 [Cucumis melo var. makuwa]|uniref:Uncharacterized protein n=1 Tax=Cucumis melo var. makuwa TaxID=1194695 RepID=A0A5D3BND9_CUCMM|nr:hypothetical protein E6C27_scaffold83G00850 [Cucumis melo var. makuwa]TYK01321.1 hypothetical protein E5676_scaffold69G00080 [Cucumis melo var. makuwa]